MGIKHRPRVQFHSNLAAEMMEERILEIGLVVAKMKIRNSSDVTFYLILLTPEH